tara:strand:- start:18 stop:950 length:933 start_codon:yes stop_codon:yes gene_type:complete
MQNKHIEHPEDSILNGDLGVLDWFTSNGKITAKIDGAPAIVWGTNPVNNKFFVGTKSVFNKKLIKINYNHTDIDRNHKGQVADILHLCLDNLPFTVNIYQGDFIGTGGTDSFNPNTIRYIFPDKVTEEIVIAPHTSYTTNGDLRDAIASPISDKQLISLWQDAKDVHFVYPDVTIDYHRDNIHDLCKFARQIATLCEFPNDKQVARIKKQLNTCIREDIEIDDLTLDALASDNDIDVNVLRLWKLVQTIKHRMFDYISCNDDIECYIGEEYCDHEGYVMVNEFGTFKIVNREGFSRSNFKLSKMRTKGDA